MKLDFHLSSVIRWSRVRSDLQLWICLQSLNHQCGCWLSASCSLFLLYHLTIKMFSSLRTRLPDFSLPFVLFEMASFWGIFSLPDFVLYGSAGTCRITQTFSVNNVNQFISCFLAPKFALTLEFWHTLQPPQTGSDTLSLSFLLTARPDAPIVEVTYGSSEVESCE